MLDSKTEIFIVIVICRIFFLSLRIACSVRRAEVGQMRRTGASDQLTGAMQPHVPAARRTPAPTTWYMP